LFRVSGRKESHLAELSKQVGVRDLVAAYDIIEGIVKKGQSLGPTEGPAEVQYSALKNGTHVNLSIVGIEYEDDEDNNQIPKCARLECNPRTFQVLAPAGCTILYLFDSHATIYSRLTRYYFTHLYEGKTNSNR
jgi:hypothetical protein